MLVQKLNAEMFYGANPILFEFAKQLRKNETETEKILWQQLSRKNFYGFRFRRQHPIRYFIADFYCHQVNLAIELDGGVHLIPEQYKYDKDRDNELEELGLKVLRIKNDEIINNIESVLNKIKEALFYSSAL